MRIAAILMLCVLLSACQSPSMAETVAILPASTAAPTIITAKPTPLPTAAPTAAPALAEDVETSERIVESELRDELDWAIPGRESIRTELWHVWIEDESIGLYGSYLHLYLTGEGVYRTYRLEDEGPMPPYYLYPCNVTGSGRDLLVSKGTTSNGIEIWLYELFTLNEDNDLILVDRCDYYAASPSPQISVRKESSRDRVKIYAEATDLNEEILLIDWPTPVDPLDWVGGGVYYLEEGKSIAELLRHQEIVPEDIDGDGKDELRLQFFLGDYKAWYGHVTAWMSYEDGAWVTAKVLLAAFDEHEYIRAHTQTIPVREITTGLELPDMTLAQIAESEGKTLQGEGREYTNMVGDTYRVGHQSDIVYSVSTENPARLEVRGLRVGSPVWEMYEKLGDPYNLYSYTYCYAIDDGTQLRIESEANHIVRFTLARP